MKLISLICILFSFPLMRAQGPCAVMHKETSCPAQFPGGKVAMRDWISLSRKNVAVNHREIVGVTFCIDTTGRPVNVGFVRVNPSRGTLTEIEKEALRLIENMPDWIPARTGVNCSEKVCEEVILAIDFYPEAGS